jgi:hypothetical protein
MRAVYWRKKRYQVQGEIKRAGREFYLLDGGHLAPKSECIPAGDWDIFATKSYSTRYGGVTFRSRLEARWAAMFDLLEWKWDYQPLDFNGWIPDFVIYGAKRVFVEVKPVTEFPQDVAYSIDRSGCSDEVVIVGMTCPLNLETPWRDARCLGWLREDGWWQPCPLGRWAASRGKIGFTHAMGSYHDRITGGYDGGHGANWVTEEELTMLWREAGNRTQWHRTIP